MECKEKDYRSFTHYSESYYAKSIPLTNGVVDDVYFGLSCGGGGTHGEMKMEWTELGGSMVPQLRVYDDGWGVLASFSDLLAEMAKVENDNITPKEFCEMLLRCGFKDCTRRVGPQPIKDEPYPPSRADYEQALQTIATLWPMHTTAKIGDVAGVNDGRNRAIIAEGAVTIARKALGIEVMP
jgi:hypothetical protein